jgi:hypothetical protein
LTSSHSISAPVPINMPKCLSLLVFLPCHVQIIPR